MYDVHLFLKMTSHMCFRIGSVSGNSFSFKYSWVFFVVAEELFTRTRKIPNAIRDKNIRKVK